MKYKELIAMTDEEIEFILKDILKAKKITKIERNSGRYAIYVGIITEWGTEHDIEEIEDIVVLTENEIINPEVYSHNEGEENWKYKQFLLAKGYHLLLKDNPYLQNEEQ